MPFPGPGRISNVRIDVECTIPVDAYSTRGDAWSPLISTVQKQHFIEACVGDID